MNKRVINRQTRECETLPAGLLIAVLLCFEPAHAAGIAVTTDAAASGGFGAEVTVGSHCPGDGSVTVDSPPDIVSGSFTACGYLNVRDVTFWGLNHQLTAGVSVSFGEGFSVAEGAGLRVSLSPHLSPYAFVTDTTPASEVRYQATFWLRLDSLALNPQENNEIAHLLGRASDGASHFELRLRRFSMPSPGENRLILAARENNGTLIQTQFGAELLLPDGYNEISINWSAGTGVGQFLVALNGADFVGLTGLNNSAARIDAVDWGIVSGEVSGASGHLDMDEFSSSR